VKEQAGVRAYKNCKFQRTSWVQVFQMLMRGAYEAGLYIISDFKISKNKLNQFG
jgi:hypothetical protein